MPECVCKIRELPINMYTLQIDEGRIPFFMVLSLGF